MIRLISKTAAKVSLVMAVTCTVAVFLMVFATLSDVGWRMFIGKSLPGATEFVGMLMVVTVFLAFAITQLHKGHVKVTLITRRFSQKMRAIIVAMTTAVVLVFIAINFWQGIIGFWESFVMKEYRFGLIAFLTWPMKLFIPVGLAGLVLQLLADTISLSKDIVKGELPIPTSPKEL